MSINSVLRMRCRIVEFVQTQEDGMTRATWQTVPGGDNVRCYLDLNYVRQGKDPLWTPETGTAQNRTGVIFFPANTKVAPNNRIQMLLGPTGTFVIESSIDEAWRPTSKHHLECFVSEVDRTLANA